MQACQLARDFPGRAANPIRFDVRNDRTGLGNYTVRDSLLIESVHLFGNGTAKASRDAHTLRLAVGESRLEVSDEPGGLLRYRGDEESSLVLQFPPLAGLTLERAGALLQYPDGARAVLIGNGTTWDNLTVRVTGFASFRMLPPVSREAPVAVQQAVERRQVGAEVQITKGAEPVQVLAYDDVHVEVALPQAANGTASVRVEFSANVTGGRTVVLNLSPGVLATRNPEQLVLRYYDVQEGGSQTQVVFQSAASLQDVLDPTDDGGQPEYWVVSDADGLHVMVSVPHWSAHAVTLTSFALPQPPSLLIGAAAGIAGILVATVGLLRPRRK